MTAALLGAARVPLAFVRRDRAIDLSYRAGLVLRLASALVTVGVFFFISHAFGSAAGTALPLGHDYFAFVLVGVALQEFLGQSVGGLGAQIRENQTTGTLELMLMSPTRLPVLLISSTLWLQVSALLSALTYLVAGTLLGADFSRADVPATVLALVLAIVGFTGLGLLAGGVVIMVKRGNPLGWAIRGASIVLGGVFYPTSVLPDGLRVLGSLLPITQALDLLRGSILQGRGIAEAGGGFLVLAIVSGVWLLAGLACCSFAIRLGRVDGSLSQY
jgi:ABC-2 type transport system permease protein